MHSSLSSSARVLNPPAVGHIEISLAAFNPGDLQVSTIRFAPVRLEAVWSETLDGEQQVLELATDLEPIDVRVRDTIRPVSLGAAPVAAGYVHQIRLITPDGRVTTLLDPEGGIITVPSGTQSGIKGTPADDEPFTIVSDRITRIEILLNAGEEIRAPGCGFDVERGRCRANPPPRGRPGRETPGGNHVFPAYILHPNLPARLVTMTGEIPPQFAPDQLFVMFEEGTPSERATDLGDSLGATILRRSRLGRPWITYLLPPTTDEREIARVVQEEPDVLVATPNYSVQALNELPAEFEESNQLPGFVYDPYWLTRIHALDAWDDLAAARGEPLRYGSRGAVVSVLDQSPYPYTPDMEDARRFNPNELPTSVRVTRRCVDMGPGAAIVLLDTDTNMDSVIDGRDWDLNGDGGYTLADFNQPAPRAAINAAMETLHGTMRASDQPILIEDLILPDGIFGTTPRCGLFEDQTDGVLGVGDGNTMPDDLIGWNFHLTDSNWLFADPFTNNLLPASHEVTLHGTKVEGFIAGAVNDRSVVGSALDLESYVGVAPGVSVLAVAWIDPESDDIIQDTFIDRMTDAIQYSVDQGSPIISASFAVICAPVKAGVPEEFRCDDEFRAEKFAQFGDVFTVLEANGLDRVLYVTGGNNYDVDTDRDDVQVLPGEFGRPYMLRVAGTDRGDEIAPLRTTGPNTHDIGAPSNDLVVLSAVGRTDTLPGLVFEEDGTGPSPSGGVSFAIPMVSATAALMISVCPSLGGDPVALRQRILDSADCNLGNLNGRIRNGCRLNTQNAVRSVLPELGGSCPP